MSNYIFVLLFLFCSCVNNQDKNTANEGLSTSFSRKKTPNDTIQQAYFTYSFSKKTNKQPNLFLGKYTLDRHGNKDAAVFLDGISDFVALSAPVSPKVNNEISISVWYKPDSYKGMGQNVLVWKSQKKNKHNYQYLLSATGNLYHEYAASFKFGLTINGLQQQIQTKNNCWSPNQWHHITGTYNGKEMRLYVNGVLANSSPIIGILSYNNSETFIGKNPVNKFCSSGVFDDFRIENTALSLTEVKRLYQEH